MPEGVDNRTHNSLTLALKENLGNEIYIDDLERF